MNINKNNYEAYFLDSIEGNLSTSLQEELDLFLSLNPDLRSELEEFEMIEVDSESVSDDLFKSSLIREESTGLTEQEYLLISEIEGTISILEKRKLEALIVANPALKEDLVIFQKTKLSNQEQVVFPNKSNLIRKQGKVIYFFRYAAASAAAILAFLWFNLSSVDKQYTPRTAQIINETINQDELLQYANVIVEEDLLELQENVVEPKTIYESLNLDPSFAQEQPIEKNQQTDEAIEKELIKEISPLEELPEENFAENPIEVEMPNELPISESDEQLASLEKGAKSEFIPLNEFAKKAILKDKTVSEAISEELAQISNDKINFESVKNKKGKVEQFALNIGKLSISRKK